VQEYRQSRTVPVPEGWPGIKKDKEEE
jgi:hypothetical protein